MKIKQIPIQDVIPYERNPRKSAAVAKVAASIKEFGWRQPIVVDGQMVIIAGHTRYLAALHLGLPKVPVHVAEGLSPAQVKAYRIADNRSAQDAEWDDALLALEIGDLREMEFDLSLTGFEDDELAALVLSVPGGVVEDEAPEAPTKAKSKIGDIYELGRHRVMCGDATELEVVAMVLDGAEPNLMVTDPPYGVEYDPAWRQREAERGKLSYAARRVGKVTNDDCYDWTLVWERFTGNVIYCWRASTYASRVQDALEAAGFELRSQITWVKRNFVLSRGHYHWRTEACWYGVRRGATADWVGDRKQTTAWDDITLDANVDGGHSTQKPVELMARSIRNHAGDVYDPFLGSGTTLIAAEQLGRTCYGIEIEPTYVDVIRQRYANFVQDKKFSPTGKLTNVK